MRTKSVVATNTSVMPLAEHQALQQPQIRAVQEQRNELRRTARPPTRSIRSTRAVASRAPARLATALLDFKLADYS